MITPRTKAIIVVHLAGWPCDMTPIVQLARERDIFVIEDCAQAHGAFYRGKPVGAFGDLAAFSFCQDKIITTDGEGGLLAMDDEILWSLAWSFKDHGKSFDAVFKTEHPPGFRWLHESFGTNWRMTSIQAVLGQRQLGRLPEYRQKRAENAGFLLRTFRTLKALRTPEPLEDISHAWYRLYSFVRPAQLKPGWTRDRIPAEINAKGVQCFTGSCPEIYLEKSFKKHGFRPAQRHPQALMLGKTSLSFLVDPCQDEATLSHTAQTVGSVMDAASIN